MIDLSTISTAELVAELSKREGVEMHDVDGHQIMEGSNL